MAKIVILTKENFEEEVYKSKLPVFIDFHTEGCGPCELMPPIMNELAEKYDGRVKFGTFDVDIDELIAESNEIVEKYDVKAFPTIMIFKDGKVKENILGAYDVDPLVEKIEKVL